MWPHRWRDGHVAREVYRRAPETTKRLFYSLNEPYLINQIGKFQKCAILELGGGSPGGFNMIVKLISMLNSLINTLIALAQSSSHSTGEAEHGQEELPKAN
ncbi:hypothetical protein GDO78_008009 [Eleutherodactylus coqui]|uniref:Uncharacterized protein n=1 Tax=Eleutherodactylus coqui TaxID=57060 RepID=A0A8J6FD97_ELECQ|nr:hypothetical protein GDO78_008009 [Eleutherodactylus coqui]